MPTLSTYVAAILLILSAPLTARAWSDAGHRIIAAIAWRQITPRQRHELLELLANHPRYRADFQDKLPEKLTDAEDQREWLFLQAAVWPDIARGLPEPHKDRFHHSTWHYINQPLFLRTEDRRFDITPLELNLDVHPPRVADEAMNIVQTIRLARRELRREFLPSADRALWLTWLFHTVGDLHQPLHSTTMIDPARLPEGDRGGNVIATKQRGNLHALWDNFPGEKLQLAESRKRALTWLHDVDLQAEATGAAEETNEDVWWKESHRLCTTVVYDEEVRTYLQHLPPEPIDDQTPRLTLSEDYLKRGGHVSRVRVLQAGLRLGAVLNKLFP